MLLPSHPHHIPGICNNLAKRLSSFKIKITPGSLTSSSSLTTLAWALFRAWSRISMCRRWSSLVERRLFSSISSVSFSRIVSLSVDREDDRGHHRSRSASQIHFNGKEYAPLPKPRRSLRWNSPLICLSRSYSL